VSQIMPARLDLHRSKSVWYLPVVVCAFALVADAPAQSKVAGSADELPATTPDTTARPQNPPKPPDPEELEVRPEEDGTLRFNFQGQPWPDVLEWLAEVSHLSLDWQELPAGFLNLRTQRSYSVDEARDLLNRHPARSWLHPAEARGDSLCGECEKARSEPDSAD
jgi:hypothetical protein